jgi:sugar lactone lactonase YvrE
MIVSLGALGCGPSTGSNSGGNSPPPTYSVTVTVSGLASGTLVTVTDSDNNASISTENTSGVTLESGLESGFAYKVTLVSPTGQSCIFSSGSVPSGTIASNVTLAVTCTASATYSVSVNVTGLAPNTSFTVIDLDNIGESVVANANTTFPLDASLPAGASYDATFTPPAAQTCAFPNVRTSISGKIAASDVTLAITCTSSILLDGPAGLAFDPTSTNLYVANEIGNQVLIYEEEFAGGGSSGSQGSPTLTQTGSITNEINSPTQLAFDAVGYLYVTNLGNNTVTVYHPSESLSQIVTTISSGLTRPQGIAVDQDGDVYVANNGANTISVYKGSPTSGFALFATLTQDATGNQFDTPKTLMFNNFTGSLDGLFVGLGPAGMANSVLLYSAPLASTSSPTGSLSSINCPTGPNGPTSIATSTGSTSSPGEPALIYVSSYNNNSVSEYTLSAIMSGGCPTPTAISGNLSQIMQPEGVAVDAAGYIFVANSGTHTITVYFPITDAPIYTQQ